MLRNAKCSRNSILVFFVLCCFVFFFKRRRPLNLLLRFVPILPPVWSPGPARWRSRLFSLTCLSSRGARMRVQSSVLLLAGLCGPLDRSLCSFLPSPVLSSSCAPQVRGALRFPRRALPISGVPVFVLPVKMCVKGPGSFPSLMFPVSQGRCPFYTLDPKPSPLWDPLLHGAALFPTPEARGTLLFQPRDPSDGNSPRP